MQQRIQTICLILLTCVAVGAALRWLRPVMIPFVLAVFIALGLNHFIDFQARRFRIPRWPALLITLVLAGLALTLVVSLVSSSVASLRVNAETYSAQTRRLLNSVTAALPLPVDSNQSLKQAVASLPASWVGDVLVGTANAVLDILSKTVLVMIFVLFLLVGKGKMQPSRGRAWGDIEWSISRYLALKTFLSAITGIAVGLTLTLLGVDLALVFGMLAFLLNFIPNVGSIIATLLPLPVVLVSPEISPVAALLAILVPGAIQMVIGNIVEPKMMGTSMDLHPVVVLFTLIFWGMLWGVVGMLLATPITAAMKMLFERLEPTRPLADLLAGRFDRFFPPARKS